MTHRTNDDAPCDRTSRSCDRAERATDARTTTGVTVAAPTTAARRRFGVLREVPGRQYTSYPAPAFAQLMSRDVPRSCAAPSAAAADDSNATRSLVDALRAGAYVDASTRFVVVDASVYSPMTQLVFALRLTFELSNVGGVVATADSDVGAFFLSHDDATEWVYLIVLGAFYLYQLLQELEELWQEGARCYFAGAEAWRNWMQLVNIVLFVVQVLVEKAGLDATPGTGGGAGRLSLHGARFNDFAPVVAAARRARQLLACNNVINWFKLILFMAYVRAPRVPD